MKTMTKVSIIVPVYNVEQYLKRCLDSIVNQTFEDYEIICVNDCSPDNSQSILEEYASEYPGLIKVVVNNKNLGLGKTREHGLSVAEGQYVMFIDSDDYIKKDYIETYYKAMCKKDVDIIIGGYTRDIDGNFTVHNVADSEWSLVTYPIACAKLYKKSFLLDNKIVFPEIRCGEDIYFSMSLFYHNATFYTINYAGYYYYFNRKSITGSMNYEKNHEEFVKTIFSEFMDNYDINNLTEPRRRVIEYNYIANMVNALITYGRGGGIKRMRKKYDFWMQDMKVRFPDYNNNPYVGFFKPKGQTAKIRLGVGVSMGLHKIKLDRLMYYIISLIK